MARTVAKSTVADDTVKVVVDTVEEVNEENKKTEKRTINTEPLMDSDEIEVVSLIPNVSYKDSKTGDMYEWDKAGHVEYMTVETLKNMWRNYKGYFRNMWLKPNDKRIINQFGLTKTFEKYEFLMDASNYTKKNINAICDAISGTPNSLKFSVCNKVKDLVVNGEVTDVSVIRTIEKRFDIDLIGFLVD